MNNYYPCIYKKANNKSNSNLLYIIDIMFIISHKFTFLE